jgi:hypothetical protein
VERRVKRLLVAAALLSVAWGSFAAEFRNTTWMMSEQQVSDSEDTRMVSALTLGTTRQLVFQTKVGGFPVTITYTLENGKLLSASMSFHDDADGAAFGAMKKALVGKNGTPAFQKADLIAWRLERTEIALSRLPDGTTYVAYWEKAYFARINNLAPAGDTRSD